MIAKSLLALGGDARGLRLRLLALWVLAVVPARAQPADTPAAPLSSAATTEADNATLEARRHFKSGTKLYRDGNYGGALAEFEEAYRLKPGAGSLQNVALSQKGLFRYAEAAATLEQLLGKHAGELNEGERKAVEDAISELKGLIASIKLRIVPATARVLLDGRQLNEAEWSAALVLNVGEHTLSVDAPGYAPERKLLRLAGGQRDVPVDIELRCTQGFVDVTTNDPTANIAIDGLPKARRAYKGAVEPDTDHLLQVYRDGVEPFEQSFRVGVCKTASIHAVLEGVDSAPAANPADATAPPSDAPKRTQKGFFGLVTLDALAISKPLALDISKAQGGNGVAALGLRAGYRLSNPVALDVRLDVGGLNVTGAYDSNTMKTRDYSLTSIHFGPDLRLMTTGEKFRFISTLGVGIVHHRLALKKEQPEEVRGIDPYFSLELGVGMNYRQFLAEVALVGLIDGSSALQKGFSDANNRALQRDLGTTLPMIGIGIRGGFSTWRPGR
ncbi:MAG TPA: hypothetical protein VHB79_24515 [Polyangiaceae bacterium]|nr:hypothetical protein [Polyangiaceae bacterium]